jgi:hypothetical protein
MTPEKRYTATIFLMGLVAFGHQYMQKQFNLQIPWLHAYLDDILCMPLFLAIWRWEKQLFWRTFQLRRMEILFFTCFIFVLFEGILPHFSTAYTADWKDGLAYSCGSSIFYLLQNSVTLLDGQESSQIGPHSTNHFL